MLTTDKEKWDIVEYNPAPLEISEKNIVYWEKQYSGCKIEYPVKPKLNNFGERVVIFHFPEDLLWENILPLGKIFSDFSNELDKILWEIYPYNKNNISKFRKGTLANGAIFDLYYDKIEPKKYTPKEFCVLLNKILSFTKDNILEQKVNETPREANERWEKSLISFLLLDGSLRL